MKIYPNVFLIGLLIILGTFTLTLFLGAMWASIVITTDNQATTFLKFALYLFTIILGTALFLLRRSLKGKFYFIKFLSTGEINVLEPLTGKKERIDKKQIRGYSRASETSMRQFVRLYFENRDEITFLDYYSDFDNIEKGLKIKNINFLGVEKFSNDNWGRPSGQMF